MQERVSYQDTRVALQRGDVILFYTDGVIRQTNVRNEMYGAERLKEALQNMKTRSMTAKKVVENLLNNVAQLLGTSPQSDDMTMVVVRVH